jgi:hypothetical protein
MKKQIAYLSIAACVVVCLAAGAVAQEVQATPPYGLSYYDQVLTITGVEVQNLKKHNYSHQISASDTFGDTATLEGSISNGKLHGHAKTVVGEHSSYAGMDAYFFDTFYITGPAGQTEQFQIDMTFTGSVATNCKPEYSPGLYCLGGGLNTFTLFENGVVIPTLEYEGKQATIYKLPGSPNDQTASVALPFEAGTSVVLGELLQFRNIAENEGATGYVTFGHDGEETAYFTVTPLTPGFAFTTASGLPYASEP